MTYQVALQVVQQAILVLAKWVDVNLASECQPSDNTHEAVIRAKQLLSWGKDLEPSYLRLLFDAVKLPDGKGQDKQHYYPAMAIANSDTDSYPSIPYPLKQPPSLSKHKQFIRETFQNLNTEDWHNLSLLILIIEKYGSCLSFGESDVALIDLVRSTAAVASAIAHDYESKQISLVAGDLSGIQKFIYTISSDGALKSLRARSFYLELVTEEVVQHLLLELELPRTSVIYTGGGNLYLLAPATDETQQKIKQVQYKFNLWLKDGFQSRVFLALDCLDFSINDVSNQNLIASWNKISQKISKQKSRKFGAQINDLLDYRESFSDRCRVCHRDDTTDLEQLNPNEDDSVLACPMCRNMFQLGSYLPGVKTIVRSHRFSIGADYTICLNFSKNTSFKDVYYHLFRTKVKQVNQTEEIVFLVNNWTLDNYQFYKDRTASPLLLGDYGSRERDLENQESSGFMRAGEFAEKAKGINRVGYLRMDVDNLGKIFAQGLNNNHTLPRLAGLSRQMSYFFKVYLNSLAKNRSDNLPEAAKYLSCDSEGRAASRPNLLFIYAGGDDLFVSGSWNEVVEFAFDVYQSFRAYTGFNPDITLSGGISINDVKHPLHQAAEESGKAENAAKGNGRDSLALFGEVFKWSEWLGANNIKDVEKILEQIDQNFKNYLSPQDKPSALGILPFVDKLNRELASSYSRAFVRNLLATAQLQKQIIKEKQQVIDNLKKSQSGESKDDSEIDKLKNEKEEIRYYLHLPKIAYTLARLPSHLHEDSLFKPIRTSLKSPYNAPYFGAIATWIELLNRSSNQ